MSQTFLAVFSQPIVKWPSIKNLLDPICFKIYIIILGVMNVPHYFLIMMEKDFLSPSSRTLQFHWMTLLTLAKPPAFMDFELI